MARTCFLFFGFFMYSSIHPFGCFHLLVIMNRNTCTGVFMLYTAWAPTDYIPGDGSQALIFFKTPSVISMHSQVREPMVYGKRNEPCELSTYTSQNSALVPSPLRPTPTIPIILHHLILSISISNECNHLNYLIYSFVQLLSFPSHKTNYIRSCNTFNSPGSLFKKCQCQDPTLVT